MSIVRRKAFGGGLDSVMNLAEKSKDVSLSSDFRKELNNVLVQKVKPGEFQPRRYFEPESLQELSDSIKERGILQPIIVRAVSRDEYEIIAGERRWRAAQMAGLSQVPVIVCELDNQAALAFGIIENIQRKDLNPIEEAEGFKRLIDEFSMTHEQVAKAVGRSRVMVSNLIRLLSLSLPVKELINQGAIEMGHARALLAIPSEQQLVVALDIIAKKLSVRQTEALVKKCLEPKSQHFKDEFAEGEAEQIRQRFSKYFANEISVRIKSDGSGKIILNFDSLKQIDLFLKQFER